MNIRTCVERFMSFNPTRLQWDFEPRVVVGEVAPLILTTLITPVFLPKSHIRPFLFNYISLPHRGIPTILHVTQIDNEVAPTIFSFHHPNEKSI